MSFPQVDIAFLKLHINSAKHTASCNFWTVQKPKAQVHKVISLKHLRRVLPICNIK